MAGIPRYEVRAGFIASDWSEIATKYTWPMIADAFRWEELAAGPLPDDDVEEINCSRRVASIFERLQTGDLRVQVSNNRGQYTGRGNGENRIRWSDDMSQWSLSGGTASLDALVAPSGALTADTFVEGVTSLAVRGITINSIALASGQNIVWSGLFRNQGRFCFQFRLTDEGNANRWADTGFDVNSVGNLYFQVATGGVYLGASAQAFGDGWVRCYVAANLGDAVSGRINIFVANSSANVSYLGNGSAGLSVAGLMMHTGIAPRPLLQTPTSLALISNADGYDPKINDVLCVKAIDASSAYSIFSGYLERWDANPALVDLQKIVLSATDVANRLRPIISTSLMAGVTHKNLLIAIMSAAQIDASQYQVEGMNDVAQFAFEDQISAGEAVADVQSAGGHYAYVDGEGRLQFRNRNFDVGTLGAVASYSNFFSFSISRDQDEIINRAEVQSRPREVYPGVTTVAWISDALFVPIGTTKQFLLDYVDPLTQETGAPVFHPAQPVQGVDIKMNASPDGNGVDYSASCSATVILNATAAEVTVSNNGVDGANAYLSVLQIFGQPVTRLPDLSQTARDEPSIGQYGERYGSIGSDLIGTANRARNLAEYMIVTLSQPSTTVQAALKNEWPDVFQRELLDLVALVNSKTAVSSMFYVRELEDTITFDGGTQHVCDMRLRLAFQKWWFTLDSPTLGRLNYNQLGF
jgi:hypothetical protein